jgi:hypothetical protein
MTEAEISDKLSELMASLTALTPPDRQYLNELHCSMVRKHEGQIHVIKDITTKLNFLGVALTYLQFDLESNRRENTYLRRMLEETSKEED